MLDSACATVAIVAIAYIESKALDKGINGKLLTLTIAAISGLGGFFLGGRII